MNCPVSTAVLLLPEPEYNDFTATAIPATRTATRAIKMYMVLFLIAL